MERKGSTTDWMVRYVPIMILVIISLFVVSNALTFNAQAAGTEISIQGHVKDIDGWCEREVGERTMDFELPDAVESVEIDGDATFRATLEGGELVTVESESCTLVEICQEGEDGRDCGTGGSLSGGNFEADLYFDGAEVIIDPQT